MPTTLPIQEPAAWLKEAQDAGACVAVVFQRDGSRGLSVGFPLDTDDTLNPRATRLVQLFEANTAEVADYIEAERPDLVLRAPPAVPVPA